MGIPKNPNPGPGAAARSAKARERRMEGKAAELRAAGWIVLSPEAAEEDTCGRNVCLLAGLKKEEAD